MSNVGILDPLGKKNNPLTNKKYQDLYISEPQFEFPPNSGKFYSYSYKNLSKIWTNLLVYKKRLEMISTFKKNQVTLVKAGTGVGKTVLVPKFALHAGNYKDKIICCIPKKIITKETADFAAKCLDVNLGEHVGYYYKGEKKIDQNNTSTVLTFTTIGSLFSRITGNDPELKNYNTIIIDEAHERSIQTDFTLLLIKEVLKKRKDLKLIIMSATIDLDKFRNFYKEFKFGEVDAGQETTYQIKDYYLKSPSNDWKKLVITTIQILLRTTKKGDILVFVRSGADGRQLCSKLSKKVQNKNYNPFCVELESKSALEFHPTSNISKSKYATHETLYKSHPDQNKQNPYTRKIVMSTNVAESSLTVKGIVYVIDSGLEFVSKFKPRTMARSLLDDYVPQSAVKQRRGRGGRTQNGFCYHLYTKEKYDQLRLYPTPDIQKTDLSNEFLDLLRMKEVGSIPKLNEFLDKLIDPPVRVFREAALKSLEALGAIKSDKITNLGLMITKFRGIKPMYAKSIITSFFYKCKRQVIDIISLIILLDSRIDLLFKIRDKVKIQSQFKHAYGDYLTLLKVINAFNEFKYGKINTDTATDTATDSDTDTTTDNASDLKKDRNPSNLNQQNEHSVAQWCYKNHLNYKILTQLKKTAQNINQILRNALKDNNKFRINPQNIKNEEKKILFCFTHKTNQAEYVNRNVYRSLFPIQKVEAKLSNDTTYKKSKKSKKNIIFDELFLSKSGYKFNIISEAF